MRTTIVGALARIVVSFATMTDANPPCAMPGAIQKVVIQVAVEAVGGR